MKRIHFFWSNSQNCDVFQLLGNLYRVVRGTLVSLTSKNLKLEGSWPRVASFRPLFQQPPQLETPKPCLFFFSGLFCCQDVAVMGSPRLTEMNQGLRRLTRTHRSPLSSSVFLFDARELGCSLPGARPRQHSLQGDKHGEKPQQQHQHQGSAPFQLYRSNTGRK